MRSFGRPAARFIRIRSSIDATRTLSPSISSSVEFGFRSAKPLVPDGVPRMSSAPADVLNVKWSPARSARASSWNGTSGGSPARSARASSWNGTSGGAAEVRPERAERLGQPLEVRVLPRVADVDVAGDDRRAPERSREAADQDEPDLVVEQRPQRHQRVERRLAHRRAARANGRVLSHARTASRPRSAGVRRRASWMRVRSRPVPGRTISTTSFPHERRSLSSVSALGDTRPCSMREIAACGTPDRRPSSRWDNPAPRRASSRIERASTPQMISKTTSAANLHNGRLGYGNGGGVRRRPAWAGRRRPGARSHLDGGRRARRPARRSRTLRHAPSTRRRRSHPIRAGPRR